MKFTRYNVDDKVAPLFRPAKALFGYQGGNNPANVDYAKAVGLLTEAFGPAIIYNDWRQVADVEAWTPEMKDRWPGWQRRDGTTLNVPKDAWYFNTAGVTSELYLTSELQINYLSLAMNNITISSEIADLVKMKVNEN